MAGDRLEHHSTLTRDELKQRIEIELSQMSTLSFAELQLLDAAQGKLRAWKEPRSKRNTNMMDDEKPEGTTEILDQAKPVDPVPPKAPVKRKSPAKKKTAEASASATPEKENDVASKAKSKPKAKSKSTAKKKTAVKTKAAPRNSNSRIDPDSKVVKTGKENPYREGSDKFKRVDLVLKNSGKTVATINKLPGMKSSTLNNCKKAGLVKFE
jgi:outer membrane biosynthesis protein TonB